MKIFVVCVKLNGGGAERVGVSLANSLASRGHHVYMISNIHEPIVYSLSEQVELKSLCANTNNTFFKWISSIKKIRSYINDYKPDVIIGIMQLCSFVAKIASLGTGIPVIMTEHDSFERPQSAPFSKKDIFCKFYLNRIYNHITVLTKADEIIARNRFKNISVMPNPLFIETKTNTNSSRQKVILAAGRIDDWHYKGFDVLLNAWGRIAKKHPDWKVNIMGKCNKSENLEFLTKIAKENNIENSVNFIGYKTNVQNLYDESEIFVLSSRYEGFGLVLIEAMNQGCAPVVCDYKGRQKEILCPEGVSSFKSQDSSLEICENGILCEPDNVEALAQAIEKMIEDEEYRNKVHINTPLRASYYSLNNTAERWENLIESII